jgi:hypothetical protein
MGGNNSRVIKHGSNIADAYSTGGYRQAGKASLRAAAEQGTRYWETHRLSRHLTPLAQAAISGDMNNVAEVALNALALQAQHASLQGVNNPEAQTNMAKVVKHLARQLPKIYNDFVNNGGNAAVAARLQSLVQSAAQMAQQPQQQDPSAMKRTARAIARAAAELALSKIKPYKLAARERHHAKNVFHDAEQPPFEPENAIVEPPKKQSRSWRRRVFG